MKTERSDKFGKLTLRQRAELLLMENSQFKTSEYSVEDTLKLVHELQVYQLELELQNNELENANVLSKQNADKYTELYNFAPNGYYTLSLDGSILELNLTAAQFLDEPRSKLVNRKFANFISIESRPIFNSFFKNIFANQGKETCDVVLLLGRNTPNIYLNLNGILESSLDKCFVSAVDITERTLAVNELRQSNEELKRQKEAVEAQRQHLDELNVVKNKFFNIVAHDFISPLNSLKAFSNLLSKHANELSRKEITQMSMMVNGEVENTIIMANNLITWAKLQMKDFKTLPEEVNVNDLIANIYAVYKSVADKKGIEITCSINDDLTVVADKSQIAFIIRNLINNAIKFTHSDGVVKIIAGTMPTGEVYISVEDNGIGISDEIKEGIFSIGKIISLNGTDGELGTGLGLLLSHEFLKLNNGTIEVDSELGKGTKFTLMFEGIEHSNAT